MSEPVTPRNERAAAVNAARSGGAPRQNAPHKGRYVPTPPPHPKDTDTDMGMAEIRKKTHAREKQFKAWDSLLKAEAFDDFLYERGLKLNPVRVPMPHCTEAEQQVLGACLVAEMLGDMKTVPMVVSKLRPQMFYHSQTHRPIFEAIVYLDAERNRSSMRKGLLIDLVTVGYYLQRQGLQSEADGGKCPAAYLTALHEMSAGTANVQAYLDIVIEMSKMRYLFQLGNMISELSQKADPQQLSMASANAVQHIQTHGWCDLETMLLPHK